jgi:hypothetical protein
MGFAPAGDRRLFTAYWVFDTAREKCHLSVVRSDSQESKLFARVLGTMKNAENNRYEVAEPLSALADVTSM